VAWVVFFAGLGPASACEGDTIVQIIGFDVELTSVVLHVSSPPLVRVEVMNLQDQSRREVHEIVTQEEAWAWQDLKEDSGRPDLDKIRARRSAELEPKLRSRGFKPLRPLPRVDKKAAAQIGFHLDVREYLKQSSMQLAYDLIAVKGDAEVVLVKQFMSASSGTSVLQAEYHLRGKVEAGRVRELLFVVGDSGFQDPPIAVLSVEEVRAKLENGDAETENRKQLRKP
jgi:hypothetical protein